MTRPGVRIEDNEDVCGVDDELHTGDDFWRARYYDRTGCMDGLKPSKHEIVSLFMLHCNPAK
jgi:hypothetical protein